MHALQVALVLTFPVLAIVAAMRDVSSYTIPNWISLALVGLFPIAALAVGLSLTTIGVSLAVGAVALVAGMGMFALGWIGGGDAKLFAAAALWLGWPACVPALVVTCVAGGGLAVTLLGLRSAFVQPFVPKQPAWLNRLATPGENVPYGLAIAIGALTGFPGSPFGPLLAHIA